MTVKELEERVGMSRANIRYYEQEGLISPAREGNGYRSYTPEDEEALLRIKLLRRLQFSIDEIRRLQSGELPMAEAMARREAQLLQESREKLSAGAVCREIGSQVESYGQLRAGEYLARLENPDALESGDVYEPHPWLRYFARALDLSLAAVLINFIRLVPMGLPPNDSTGAKLLTGFLGWLLVLAVEPLWIHFLGTTPGKWVLGIRVERTGGGRLSLSDAYARTFGIFIYGEGAYIPFVGLVCNILSYRKCMRGEACAWEENSVERFSELGWKAPVMYVGVQTAVFFLVMYFGLIGMLPENRGELTVAEFSENFNSYCEYLGMSDRHYLDDQGKWQENKEAGAVVYIGGESLRPDFEFTLSDGYIKEIRYSLEAEGQLAVFADPVYAELAYLSSAAARPGTTAFNIRKLVGTMDDWDLNSDVHRRWKDLDMDFYIRCSGDYQSVSSGMCIRIGG